MPSFAWRTYVNNLLTLSILKFIADNLGTVSSKTHALLAGIRALVKEARIRFISGRPRKRTVDDRQMALPGF